MSAWCPKLKKWPWWRMLNPGVNNCVDYILQKSFRIQIKLDVIVKIFMTQSWKKNSAYQWKDHNSFKVMEMMAWVIFSIFLFFTKSFLAQSICVLWWGKSQLDFYLSLIFGAFNEWNQDWLSWAASFFFFHIFYYMSKKCERELAIQAEISSHLLK